MYINKFKNPDLMIFEQGLLVKRLGHYPRTIFEVEGLIRRIAQEHVSTNLGILSLAVATRYNQHSFIVLPL
jgi:hypothetical protein